MTRGAVLIPLGLAVLLVCLAALPRPSRGREAAFVRAADDAVEVKVFRLRPSPDSTCTGDFFECFHGHPVEDRDPGNTDGFLDALGAALADWASFDSSRGARDCEFTPELGVQWTNPEWPGPVDILFSFHGEQVWVTGHSFDHFGDFTGHRSEFLAFARRAFRGDDVVDALPDSEPGVAWVPPDSIAGHHSPWKLRRNHPAPRIPAARDAADTSSHDEEPVLNEKVAPVYPEIAKSDHLEGRVVLDIQVDESGAVAKIVMIEGPPVFRESAVEAVKQWVFRHALKRGKPVAVWVRVPLNYRLFRAR